MKEHIKILVCGRPNVGKSLIINKITNSNLKTNNSSEDISKKCEISIKKNKQLITFIRIPGIYNLHNQYSENEKLSVNFIKNCKNEYDLVLYVIDVFEIEESLKLLLEIKKIIQKPIIIALNLSNNTNLSINSDKLFEKTGHKCIKFSTKDNNNITIIIDTIVSQAIIEKQKMFDPNEVFNYVVIKNKNFINVFDKIVLNKYFGIPIFMCVMFFSFVLTFVVGKIPSDFIEMELSKIAKNIANILPKGHLHSLFFYGFVQSIIIITSFLPRIMILFLCISIIEKTGYIERIAVIMDKFLKIFGIKGKSIIPIISGFGCSVPAYMSTRILNNKYQKIATMFAISIIPCNAKMTVLVLLIGTFFSVKYAPFIMFLIYFISFIIGLVIAFIVSYAFNKNINSDSSIICLPEYHIPQISFILNEAWYKIKQYIKNVSITIGIVSFFIWLLCNVSYKIFDKQYWDYQKILNIEQDEAKIIEAKQYVLSNSIVGKIGQISEPIFAPLGFDWKMNISLFVGLNAKEFVISAFSVLYPPNNNSKDQKELLLETRLKKEIPFASGISFLIFMLVYTPCISAVTTFAKESESIKYTLIMVIGTTIIAWILAYIGYNIALLL